MVKNSFYIENLKIKLKIVGNKTQKLAYLFRSKVPRKFPPHIFFFLDMLLKIYKNFFHFHYKK